MKKLIIKAIVLCTLALSLLFVGVSAVEAGNAGVSVAGILGEYDGPYDSDYVY